MEHTMMNIVYPLMKKVKTGVHDGCLNELHSSLLKQIVSQKLSASIGTYTEDYPTKDQVIVFSDQNQDKSTIISILFMQTMGQ